MKLMLLVFMLLIGSVFLSFRDCGSGIRGAKAKYAMSEPVIRVARALSQLDSQGKPLPDDMHGVAIYIEATKETRDPEWTAKAREFVEHGVYLRNFVDGKNKKHRALLLYYVEYHPTKAYIMAISSEEWLNTMQLRVPDAEALFGAQAVAEAINRQIRGSS